MKIAELRYKPWGETRYTAGTTPTSFQYTLRQAQGRLGQRHATYLSL